MKTALAVLGRAPRLGQVKTRLAREVGDGVALAAYRCMLHATLYNASSTGLPVHLFASEPDHPDIVRLSRSLDCACQAQDGGDLGQRMSAVFRQLLRGYQRVLLVGTDCPSLSGGHYWQALGLLEQADVALQAARDGGYVLIGANRHPLWQGSSPFAGVRFGTASARQDTLGALAGAGLQVQVAGALYDIDTAQDWQRWQESGDPGLARAEAFWEQGAHD